MIKLVPISFYCTSHKIKLFFYKIKIELKSGCYCNNFIYIKKIRINHQAQFQFNAILNDKFNKKIINHQIRTKLQEQKKRGHYKDTKECSQHLL